jgi:hypothetical protein
MRPADRPDGNSILVDKCCAPARGCATGGENNHNEPMGGLGVGTDVCKVGCDMVGSGGFAHRSDHVGVKDDAFLDRVAQMVTESDDGRWRVFFRAPDSTLRYHREGDETARICVSSKCRGDVIRVTHGEDLLTDHPGIDRTLVEFSRYWYLPTLTWDGSHFCRSCRVCPGEKDGNHLSHG